MNHQEALWLPPGSVRAILALMLTAGLILGVFLHIPAEALAILAGPAGMVVQAYFQKQRA